MNGILPQAIEALAQLHDAGFAHRVLAPGCIQLSTKVGMNKNVALEECDPGMLSVKLSDFGRAAALVDMSTPGEGGELVARDLVSLGLAFLQVLLASLSETQRINPATSLYEPIPSPPPVGGADLARRIALFDGRMSGEGSFSEFCRGEPAWIKVVALLDADKGAGWEFLAQLISAPAVITRGDTNSRSPRSLSARSLREHPFLRTQAFEVAARGAQDEGKGTRKLFGLFDW